MTICDQHHVTTPQEEVRAHLRKAIRELQALEASVPVASMMTVQRQRDSAHNYIENVALRVAEIMLDCTLAVSSVAASLGNDDRFDVKGIRECMMEPLRDGLFDASQWADEREYEDA
ncbi:hypothetical protein [Mesorhizobium sp. Z1-4]|uniref:hypothetical protein n=1 Tax=Mesorhizobium sp. Z1-4 TaxID=2448478 RepID=UPI000FD6C141|nr:hypothetical protein [Mesorhizobium sp. Z1-4]